MMMSEEQIFQAFNAIFETLFALKKTAAEALDPQDGRMELIEQGMDKLSDVLYVQPHKYKKP